jgi:hypothetical protein
MSDLSTFQDAKLSTSIESINKSDHTKSSKYKTKPWYDEQIAFKSQLQKKIYNLLCFYQSKTLSHDLSQGILNYPIYSRHMNRNFFIKH